MSKGGETPAPQADDEMNRALIRRTTVRLTCSRGSPLDLPVRGDSLRAFLAALAQSLKFVRG